MAEKGKICSLFFRKHGIESRPSLERVFHRHEKCQEDMEREEAQEQGQNSEQHEQNGSQHKQNVEHDVKTKHSLSHLSRQDIHATTQSNVLKNKQSHGDKLTYPNRTRQDVMLKELSDFEDITVTDIQVHCEVKRLFTGIGDLFDDADTS